MRLDLRRMSWPELATLLKDVAREIEQRGTRSANPQYRDNRVGGYGGGSGYSPAGYGGGPPFRGPAGPRGKKRFAGRRGPPADRPPNDGDFNR